MKNKVILVFIVLGLILSTGIHTANAQDFDEIDLDWDMDEWLDWGDEDNIHDDWEDYTDHVNNDDDPWNDIEDHDGDGDIDGEDFYDEYFDTYTNEEYEEYLANNPDADLCVHGHDHSEWDEPAGRTHGVYNPGGYQDTGDSCDPFSNSYDYCECYPEDCAPPDDWNNNDDCETNYDPCFCDGIDCDDTKKDVKGKTTWYYDFDGDGWYTDKKESCEKPGDKWTKEAGKGDGDGCPEDPCCHTDGLPFYEDKDTDGWYVKGTGNKCPKVVNNDPKLSRTNPNPTEDCNDDNVDLKTKNECGICTNNANEGKIMCYEDKDGDGWGAEDSGQLVCEPCSGVTRGGDHNDNCYNEGNWWLSQQIGICGDSNECEEGQEKDIEGSCVECEEKDNNGECIPCEEGDVRNSNGECEPDDSPDPCNVEVEYGSNVNTENINECSLQKLKELADEAGIDEFLISSGARTPEDQARIMFNYTKIKGVAKQKALYGSNGDKVIDVYVAEKAAGKADDEIKQAMLDKINELGPNNVSNHCSDPDVRTTVDIAPSSIVDINKRADFISAVEQAVEEGTVHRILHPGNSDDDAYHIEVDVEDCDIKNCD